MKRNILYDKQGINYHKDQLVRQALSLSLSILNHDIPTEEITNIELSIEAIKHHYQINEEVSTQKKYKKRRLEKLLYGIHRPN